MSQIFVSLISNTNSVVNCNMSLSRITSFSPEGQSALMESSAIIPREKARLG